MNYLSIDGLSKSFGERILFQDIFFGLEQGQKTALVGVNGCGKSTLLRIIMGEEPADKGSVSLRKGIQAAFLRQNPHFSQEETALSAIFNSENETLRTIRDYELALLRAEAGQDDGTLSDLLSQMDALNAWDYESQVKQILGELGIHDFEQRIATMSGGQKKRVGLAQILVTRPDLLIMDEPTNHLDLDVIEWLENYLSTQNMTLLMVTHDRYFLDRVCNEVVEMEDGQLYRYKGNYAYFLEKKGEREVQQVAEVEKARNLMRKELDWMRRQPQARGTKAKYRVEAFYELQDKASQNLNKSDVELDVIGRRQGKKIMEMTQVSKRFDANPVLDNFNYIFKKSDRIGIVGPNGVGKSTFLNMLTGKETIDSGELDKGANTVFGYYTQEELHADPQMKVIDYVKQVAEVITMSDGSVITASQMLNRFLFSPKRQYDYVYKLSGGEKRRLQLLRVLMLNPNFLILDEPTNDLDILTLNVLEEFLEGFQGCLLLVSHDRYFMDRLVDSLFVFEGQGQVRHFPGNYTDYRQWSRQQQKQVPAAEVRSSTPPSAEVIKKTEKKPKMTFKEKQELDRVSSDIQALEEEKKQLEKLLANAQGSSDDFMNWGKKLDEINKLLDEKEIRWLELSEMEA
ncbi:MAG: ABC-F family ATP-binding cassette domain-containing protein [Cytophagales bacterium]|nr:ABC-F family ATP-binding cassette domain-containing protein [Cytophagales bacterium]